MNLAAALALSLGLAAIGPAAAAPAAEPAFTLAVDPRFELLGVLCELAGRGRRSPGAASDYRAAARRRFKPFRTHPAVETLKRLLATPGREEAVATLPIHYSAPPDLALLDEKDRIPYLEGAGQREEMDRFLEQLRDFARASDFMGFFAENAELYRTVEADARRRLGGVDPVAEIEGFVGMPLASRSHYILPLLHESANNYIVPYPLPVTADGAKSFDVYTVSPDLASDEIPHVLWTEIVYVFVDPAFHFFDKLYVPSAPEFYGAEVARCRAKAPDCAKHYVSEAIADHLRRKAFPGRKFERLSHPLMRALSERLDEYERGRDRYPTLWDFLPRLLAVFPERAFPGRTPIEHPATRKPIRSVVDFFDAARKPGAN